MKRIALVLLSIALAGCSARGCGGAATERPELVVEPATGVRVQVLDAQSKPILSRIAVFGAHADGSYSRRITEAWSRPGADTLILLEPGEVLVRAQGTGDSFLESKVTVAANAVAEVKLGFGSLILDGSALPVQGRVRVWQRSADESERVVVTRLVRAGERPELFFGQGRYRLAFLPDGAADDPDAWKPLAETAIEPGAPSVVAVNP